MFNRKQIRSLCFLIIISVFLIGVCPTGMVADSFFAFSPSVSAVSRDATKTVMRPTASTTTRTVVYTREAMPEYETMLIPVDSLRRFHIRHGNRDCFTTIDTLSLSSFFSNFSGTYTGHSFDEIISNTVIIHFIHHQDGEKA